MNLKTNKVALLVHACDRYELLYKGFEFFFQKNWSFDIECNYYFATEEKIIVINNFENIHSGKGEWADRLAFLLKEKIQEDYVLYFQEDMWLDKKINSSFFNQLFKLAISSKWEQVKLHSSEIYKTIATSNFIEGFNVTKIDNFNSDFLMSHQVTLWNKEFLLKQLHRKEHPWRNERKATKRLRKLNPEIYHLDYFSENGTAEINSNNNPVLRSEYKTISHNGVLNNQIEGFIEQLRSDDKGDKQYASRLEHNYINKLTHDGKPKPKKTDIFKRTKNWLTGK